MKKSLLLMGLALAGTSLIGNAESKVYVFDQLGIVEGVADNGQYAAITDDEQSYAYLWRASNPDELYDITEENNTPGLPASQRPISTYVYDVSNDGVVVGSIGYGDYHIYPAVYKDGKWAHLPLDAEAVNDNAAVAITPDGKVIAGYQQMSRNIDGESIGQYVPCQWFLQDDGEYELKIYKDIELPNHQGFYPMAQTPDGKVIAGTVYCGVGSRINALIKEGELVLFDEIETKYEPWMVRGKYYAGEVEDEDGEMHQVWVEDVNDPRVVLFPEVYIDGYHDGRNGDEDFLEGIFDNCDGNGNLYGARNYVKNVNEDGEGEHYSDACIYNYITDTWYLEQGVNFFSAGIGDTLLFTGDGYVIEGDEVTPVVEKYGIESSYTIEGISKISWDAKTLAGVASEVNPANGESQYLPFLIQIDGGTSGVPELVGSVKKGLVILTEGRIEVVNAENVAVYDLNGRLVSNSKVTEVPAGIYVVKADEASYKVVVK